MENTPWSTALHLRCSGRRRLAPITPSSITQPLGLPSPQGPGGGHSICFGEKNPTWVGSTTVLVPGDTIRTKDVSVHLVIRTASKCESRFCPRGPWYSPFLTFKDILGKIKKKRNKEKRTEPKHVFLHYHKEGL